MDFIRTYFEPENLVFTVPLALMLLNVVLQLLGLGLGNLVGGAQGAGQGLFGSALSFLNAGDVSVFLILQLLLAVFGLAGPILNYYVLGKVDFFGPAVRFLIATPAAALLAVLFTKVVTAVVASYFPSRGPLNPATLEGTAASVVSKTLTREYGRAKTALPSGEHRIFYCRMAEGEPDAEQNDRVFLLRYDRAADAFECSRTDPRGAS